MEVFKLGFDFFHCILTEYLIKSLIYLSYLNKRDQRSSSKEASNENSNML